MGTMTDMKDLARPPKHPHKAEPIRIDSGPEAAEASELPLCQLNTALQSSESSGYGSNVAAS